MEELLLAYGDISSSDDDEATRDQNDNGSNSNSLSNVMTVQDSIDSIMSAINNTIPFTCDNVSVGDSHTIHNNHAISVINQSSNSVTLDQLADLAIEDDSGTNIYSIYIEIKSTTDTECLVAKTETIKKKQKLMIGNYKTQRGDICSG